MKPSASWNLLRFAPVAGGLLALGALGLWLSRGPDTSLALRVPGADAPPGMETVTGANAVLAGKVIRGPGVPATNLAGAWPWFRGPLLSGASPEKTPLARAWDGSGPRELWAIDVGEGFAGPAVRDGRVYLMDYDQTRKQDALRCLSLADGREIWRFTYPVPVKRNHGMSRTVPALTGQDVIAIGPKCHVVCLDAVTGELKWGLDMVKQFGTKVPPWYAGQCPLIQGDQLILAPGGPEALLAAVDIATGEVRWRSPNPRGWAMTHSSITPVEFAGQKQYVYCASHGVVGVAADDGRLLWDTPDWKISIATVPSPIDLGNGRLFFSGGYDAGALFLQLTGQAGKIVPQVISRLEPKVFGSTQQTPILEAGHLFGVRPDGKFVCLDLTGKVVWTSEPGNNFGLGPYLLANGLFFVMNDNGRLALLEATPAKYTPLGKAQVLKGHESWGPMALAGNRLLARDVTRLVCLDVGAQ